MSVAPYRARPRGRCSYASGRSRRRGAGYLPPVATDGMTFPIARSDWYSVINFSRRLARSADAVHQRHAGARSASTKATTSSPSPGRRFGRSLGGQVEHLGWTFYSGWRVGIRGDDGRYWFYAHLRRLRPRSRDRGPGRAAATLSARWATPGTATTPAIDNEFTYHLHVGIQEADGTWVNPYPLMARLYREAVQDA